LGSSACSSKQFDQWRAGAERLREAVLGHFRFEWHTQSVKDRRAEILRANRLVLHISADLVRLAVHRSAANAAAGQDRRVAVRPMLPAGDVVVLIDLWRA